MEQPQPRPLRSGGRRLTHDFLSLYPSPAGQDPRPSPGYLHTHDFLQPLECGDGNRAKEENKTVSISAEFPAAAAPKSAEHILPGGFGTYSISHVSCFNQRVPTQEGPAFTAARGSSSERNEETSNCSSHTGSAGFTLWDESAVDKGNARKEKVGERSSSSLLKEPVVKVGQPTSAQLSQFSTLCNTSSPLSTSQPLGQKKQSFIDMIKAAKSLHEAEEDEEEGIVFKKECPSLNGDVTVKLEAKTIDQKANTPRSKHSATEQRRRSKINDRFQMLRELIPHKDHKRDKASFLLEVIEYIHFLQEKVHKYERSYRGWDHELPKPLARRSICNPTPSLADQQTRGHIDDDTGVPRNAQTRFQLERMGPQPGLSEKAEHLPPSASLQQSVYQPEPVHDGGHGAGGEENRSGAQSQAWRCRPCTTDCALEPEMTVKGGTIDISTAYSQGLLNTLTQALESSGVDLSQARLSVQIELGNAPILRDNTVPSGDRAGVRSRASSCGGASDPCHKKLKTSRN